MSGALTGMPNMAGLYGLGMTGLQPEAMRRMMIAQQMGQGAGQSGQGQAGPLGGANQIAQGLLAAYLMGHGFGGGAPPQAAGGNLGFG